MTRRSASRIAAAWLVALAGPACAQAEESAPARTVRLAVHLHSTISSGELDPARVLALAKASALDGVVFTDSALRQWEYGLWPLRGLIKRVVTQPSVSTFGIPRYFRTIQQLSSAPPGVMAIPGIEAAPFYYWRRSPFDRLGGEIRNWHQHLLVLGLSPEAVQQLPSSTFDPYHGDRGAVPYQQFIDAVTSRGGLVFWAHPAAEHTQRVGSVEIYTAPYPHLLEETFRYDGFAVSDLRHVPLVEPGGLWDRLLAAFLEGRRERPTWILGELDWHRPSERPLDSVVTVLWVTERTPEAVLAAMRAGRMAAVLRTGKGEPLWLDAFDITDVATQRTAGMGETLTAGGPIRLHVSGRRTMTDGEAQVLIVKNGAVVQTEERRDTAFVVDWTDEAPGGRNVYRVILQDPSGRVYANPVVVQGASP